MTIKNWYPAVCRFLVREFHKITRKDWCVFTLVVFAHLILICFSEEIMQLAGHLMDVSMAPPKDWLDLLNSNHFLIAFTTLAIIYLFLLTIGLNLSRSWLMRATGTLVGVCYIYALSFLSSGVDLGRMMEFLTQPSVVQVAVSPNGKQKAQLHKVVDIFKHSSSITEQDFSYRYFITTETAEGPQGVTYNARAAWLKCDKRCHNPGTLKMAWVDENTLKVDCGVQKDSNGTLVPGEFKVTVHQERLDDKHLSFCKYIQ